MSQGAENAPVTLTAGSSACSENGVSSPQMYTQGLIRSNPGELYTRTRIPAVRVK